MACCLILGGQKPFMVQELGTHGKMTKREEEEEEDILKAEEIVFHPLRDKKGKPVIQHADGALMMAQHTRVSRKYSAAVPVGTGRL